MEIAKIYKDAGKSRRRDSIFRPYKVSVFQFFDYFGVTLSQGDYLEALLGDNIDELNTVKYV